MELSKLHFWVKMLMHIVLQIKRIFFKLSDLIFELENIKDLKKNKIYNISSKRYDK